MPKPPTDLLEDEVQTPPTKVRKGVAEVSLPDEILSPGMPIIRARVVYLGPGENHAVSFTGQIHEEWLEDPDGTRERTDRDGQTRRYTVVKKASDTGITQYDFSIRDARGHLMPERMMPDQTELAKLRGRPFTWCEHVGHLRQFYLATDKPEGGQRLYHLMVKPEHVAILQDHIKRTERGRRQQAALFAEVTR